MKVGISFYMCKPVFQMDVGMVWEQANHAFVNKWLLLSDPEDNMAGAKGYLKFCAIVLGPGDTPPVWIKTVFFPSLVLLATTENRL